MTRRDDDAAGADAPGAAQAEDLALLESAVTLTTRRVNVPIRRVFEHLHGRAPRLEEFVDLRLAILRLERDGLLHSDRELTVEPTPDGQVAAELLRARRAAGHN
jgi:hypothetical protein